LLAVFFRSLDDVKGIQKLFPLPIRAIKDPLDDPSENEPAPNSAPSGATRL
jgi:hypothetical protein